MKPQHVSYNLLLIASRIDASSNPQRELVVRDLRRLVAAMDDEEGPVKWVQKFVVYWDYDQKLYDNYLDTHSKYPDDVSYFWAENSYPKNFDTEDEARKWAKKKFKTGIEGKDFVIFPEEFGTV